VVTPSFLDESITAEILFAMSATRKRSPIDPQAVNGCRRKSDKAHSGIFDAVASARATPLIFGRQIDVVKPVPESPLLCLKQLRGDHLLDRLTRGTVFKQLGYSHR
jgi:hypothetical protein